ncbi:MAG: Lpg1974 family pore-forming outer membrane protein [Firmicutes bacterium]|nr:Lpg1974 family pore-forming outer membrane protein [Bacillota bacterium]MDH7496193.1 Lpg1974 family pore-forming outer membrane protein [Bacillota bacterium]
MFRKTVLTLVLVMVAILTVSGAALGSGFDAKLDVFLGMSLSGADEDLGAEVFYYQEHSEEDALPEVDRNGDWLWLEEYGWTTTPIALHPTIGGTPWRLSLGYTVGNTRFAVSWLGVQGQASASGSVPGYYEHYDEESDSWEWSCGIVDFWDMGLDVYYYRGFPGWYEAHAIYDYTGEGYEYEYTSAYDPEAGASKWSASQKLGLGSMYVTAEHPIVKGDSIQVNVLGGLHRTTWQEDLDQHLGVVFHESYTYTYLYEDTSHEYNDTYHNDVSIDTSSSVSYQGIGPAVGFTGNWEITNRFGISLSAIGSYLAGTATFRGRGTDVDAMSDTYTESENGEVTYQDEDHVLLSGEMNLAETTKAVNAIATQVDLSLKYDVTDSIFVEGGLFYALWKGLPMAPRWHYPIYTGGPGGVSAALGRLNGNGVMSDDQWTLDHTSDVSLSGWKLGIGLRF